MSAPVRDLRGPGGRLPAAGRLLAPLGWLYGLGAALNGAWQDSRKVSCRKPLVSLGNLELGGTGKTPATLALARMLLDSGRKPGILTGLWGPGRNRGVLRQNDPDFLELAPDEAALYSDRLPGLPLAAASPKWQGALALDRDPACDLILLDDGYQHRRLHRDLDLLLLGDATHLSTFGVLPAGPLREFPGALKRADAILMPVGGERTDRVFEPCLEFDLNEGALTDLAGESVQEAAGGYIVAAGIARPERFERSAALMCRRRGLDLVECLRFEDHQAWSSARREELVAARKRHPKCGFLITEKDARRWASSWDLEGPRPHVLGLDLVFREPERLLALLEPLYSSSSA